MYITICLLYIRFDRMAQYRLCTHKWDITSLRLLLSLYSHDIISLLYLPSAKITQSLTTCSFHGFEYDFLLLLPLQCITFFNYCLIIIFFFFSPRSLLTLAQIRSALESDCNNISACKFLSISNNGWFKVHGYILLHTSTVLCH